MAKTESEKQTNTLRTLTLNQQKLEEYINGDEDAGQFLQAMGVITKEELAAGIHQDEEFRVKIEADSSFADQKAAELDETGQVRDLAKA